MKPTLIISLLLINFVITTGGDPESAVEDPAKKYLLNLVDRDHINKTKIESIMELKVPRVMACTNSVQLIFLDDNYYDSIIVSARDDEIYFTTTNLTQPGKIEEIIECANFPEPFCNATHKYYEKKLIQPYHQVFKMFATCPEVPDDQDLRGKISKINVPLGSYIEILPGGEMIDLFCANGIREHNINITEFDESTDADVLNLFCSCTPLPKDTPFGFNRDSDKYLLTDRHYNGECLDTQTKMYAVCEIVEQEGTEGQEGEKVKKLKFYDNNGREITDFEMFCACLKDCTTMKKVEFLSYHSAVILFTILITILIALNAKRAASGR